MAYVACETIHKYTANIHTNTPIIKQPNVWQDQNLTITVVPHNTIQPSQAYSTPSYQEQLLHYMAKIKNQPN